jgi:hypothetical protein
VGVSADRFEEAYRAWAENAQSSEPPWVLLAIWVKEGLTAPAVPNRIPASSEGDARAIWRSAYYYNNMGADHFVHFTATGGDNRVSLSPGSGANHQSSFEANIRQQAAAGRLPRDISAEIDAEITVTPVSGSPGEYDVSATPRFRSLSLMLVDAYFRENKAALSARPDVTGWSPSDEDLQGLTYMRWNMGQARMEGFLTRSMSGNVDPGGTTPTLPVWAFHREVVETEWGQPRANAVRFLYAARAYRLAYEGWSP